MSVSGVKSNKCLNPSQSKAVFGQNRKGDCGSKAVLASELRQELFEKGLVKVQRDKNLMAASAPQCFYYPSCFWPYIVFLSIKFSKNVINAPFSFEEIVKHNNREKTIFCNHIQVA